MLTLTTPITVPNITRFRVAAVQFDGDNNVANVTVIAQGAGGLVYATYQMQVRDGQSQGLRSSISPLGFTDRTEVWTTTVATGFTDLLAAYTGANVNARNRAAETALLAAGLFPAGVVS